MRGILDYINENIFDVESEEIETFAGMKLGNAYIKKIEENEIYIDSDKSFILIDESSLKRYVRILIQSGYKTYFIFEKNLRICPSYKPMDFHGLTFLCEKDYEFLMCSKIYNLEITSYDDETHYSNCKFDNCKDLSIFNSDIECYKLQIIKSKFPKLNKKSYIFVYEKTYFAIEPKYQWIKDELSEYNQGQIINNELLSKIFKTVHFDENNKSLYINDIRFGDKNTSKYEIKNQRNQWFKE